MAIELFEWIGVLDREKGRVGLDTLNRAWLLCCNSPFLHVFGYFFLSLRGGYRDAPFSYAYCIVFGCNFEKLRRTGERIWWTRRCRLG